MNMTPESLRRKYGNTAVMGVDASLIESALKDGYTCRKDAMIWIDGVCFPLKHIVQRE